MTNRTLENEMLIKVYPDGGHGITDPLTGEVQEVFLKDLVQFISSSAAQVATVSLGRPML